MWDYRSSFKIYLIHDNQSNNSSFPLPFALFALESQGVNAQQPANMPADTNFYFAPWREVFSDKLRRRHRREE
jgi:hypothetical protein